MNVPCLGGRVMGLEVAWDHTQTFVVSRFSGADRHRRRLAKVARLEGSVSMEEGGIDEAGPERKAVRTELTENIMLRISKAAVAAAFIAAASARGQVPSRTAPPREAPGPAPAGADADVVASSGSSRPGSRSSDPTGAAGFPWS